MSRMTIKKFTTGFIVALILFLIGDFLWHGWILGDFYMTRLDAINGTAMSEEFPLFILAVEVISALGLAYFVPAIARTPVEGMWNGAFLGLIVASTLNFVNHSLILKWDLTLTLVDTAWGIVMGAIVGAAIIMVGTKRV